MSGRSVGRWCVLVMAALAFGGCTDLFSPAAEDVIPSDQLQIVQVATDAPQLTHTDVSVVAVKGQATELQMTYDVYEGGNGKCLRFIIPAESLMTYPDGRPIKTGDTVTINIRVLNTSQFLFEFDPAGIKFNPAAPARLEIRYAWADVNGDGVANEADGGRLALYRQERPGQVWEKIPSTQNRELQEIHATITSFTRYALASD